MYQNFTDPTPKMLQDIDSLDKEVKKFQEVTTDFSKIQSTIDGVSGGIPCSVLGLIPDSDTAGADNYAKLLAAVKQGNKILVDGTYYIKSSYGVNDNDIIEVPYDLRIQGTGKDSSKLISQGGRLFNTKKNVSISRVSIECPSNTLTYLICLVAPFVSNIEVSQCYISGNLRVVDSTIPQDFDFTTTECRVPNITIKDNDFYDVYNSSGSRIIFRLGDTPVTDAYLQRNRVTNFSYVFYSNGITNGHPSEAYLRDNSERNFIEDNIVVCTDSYDPKARNGGFMAGYYCFALLESYSCDCTGNRFEGFHISDAPDTVVYDNYFSVTRLNYEGNTFKNIVNFTPNLQYVDIMKSKMGGTTDNSKITRVYLKNSYIMEPEYADKFGKDRFLLRKQIDTYQEWIDDVTIEDNYFDLYTLSFNRFKYAKNYTFNKNTIKTFTVENSVNTQAFIGIVEFKKTDGSLEPRVLTFTNNTIQSKNVPSGGAVGTLEYSLIRNYTGNGDKVEVIFENNTIQTHNLKYIVSDERTDAVTTADPCVLSVKFNRNTVNNTTNNTTYIVNKKFKRLNSFNNNQINTLITDNQKSLYVFYEQSTVDAATRFVLPVCMDLELDMNYTAGSWLRIIPLKGLMDGNYKVDMNVKIQSLTTFESYDVSFTLKNDGTNNIVECKGLDNKAGETAYTDKSYVLDGSAGSVYSNFYIQQENLKGASTSFVNVSNAPNSKEIMIQSKSPRASFNNDRVKIKLTVSKV
jgi:hypothetical protein